MNELYQEEDKVINDRGNSRRRVSKKGQKFQISMRHVVCNSHDFNVASKKEGASHMFSVPPLSSAISYLPTTKARRRNFQPNAAHSTVGSLRDNPSTVGPLPVVTRRSRPTVRSGHHETAPVQSGHCRSLPRPCNHSTMGHDPVSLSVLDPANKGFP
ncbi:hypothetical protein DY000_02052527 [Brassica cretica]|uniref:Uncharacterized protein n=1 Tax=Brassica cretica TaxID=69181 RepID=A0ABQ7ADB8_BRACR|nr:hypothetical protein DY000_02052527 [Brassica cretica]